MVSPPTSAKLKSEVATRGIRRHRVRTGAVSTGGPDLQWQIEFHARPVFMRPEFVVSRRKRIQQRTGAQRGPRSSAHAHSSFSRLRPRMKKHESSSSERSCDLDLPPEAHHNLRAFWTPTLHPVGGWPAQLKPRSADPARSSTS